MHIDFPKWIRYYIYISSAGEACCPRSCGAAKASFWEIRQSEALYRVWGQKTTPSRYLRWPSFCESRHSVCFFFSFSASLCLDFVILRPTQSPNFCGKMVPTLLATSYLLFWSFVFHDYKNMLCSKYLCHRSPGSGDWTSISESKDVHTADTAVKGNSSSVSCQRTHQHADCWCQGSNHQPSGEWTARSFFLSQSCPSVISAEPKYLYYI